MLGFTLSRVRLQDSRSAARISRVALFGAVLMVGAFSPSEAAAMQPARPLVQRTVRPAADLPALQTAVFAGGCFWGVEAVFEHIKGVKSVVSGYAGGTVVNPSYQAVSTGRTGHAESVRITFDPAVVSYETLLQVFFAVAHDPTELNRQGPDVGTQYRSAVFYENAEQQKAATNYIAKLTSAKAFKHPIVTQVAALQKFYDAEGYHQNYLYSHTTEPYIVYNDLPKLDALKEQFPGLWENTSGK